MVLANTQHGQIEGFTKDNIQYFLGIPYAKPPIDALRFMAPQAPEPWQEILDCQKPSCSAPQVTGNFALVDKTNEDCLYLNVVTPGIDEKKDPLWFGYMADLSQLALALKAYISIQHFLQKEMSS